MGGAFHCRPGLHRYRPPMGHLKRIVHSGVETWSHDREERTMHLTAAVVTGSTVSDACLRTVTSVTDVPGQRCYHAVTRIAHPASHVLQIRTAADWLSERRGYPAIDTVANTIFPEALA